MNIAVFSRSTTQHFTAGGMETHLKNLVEGLAERGHKVTVFTTSYPKNDNNLASMMMEDKYVSQNGVDYVYIGNTTPGLNPITIFEKIWCRTGFFRRTKCLEGHFDYFKESVKRFDDVHKKNSFDVIISQSTAGRGVIGKVKIPVISIIHGTISTEIKNRLRTCKTIKNWLRFALIDFPRWKYELATSNKTFFKRIDAVIAVSGVLKKNFLQEQPYAKSKAYVIYNGVDEKLFKPGKKKYKDFTVLFIGRMDREKGVDIIIKAVQKLRNKGTQVKVKLIGGGVHLEELKQLAKDLNVQEEVEFVGLVQNERLPTYYQMSHVFVFPTRREEGHPMTISEAFCSGLPVISTKKGGLIEIVENNKTGLFINDDSPDDLADRIFFLKKRKNILKNLSDGAYKKGISQFSKNAMILQYERLLKSIL